MKKDEVLPFKADWNVFILEGSRKRFLGSTKAVSQRRAVTNIWWREIVPTFGKYDEGHAYLERMTAERVVAHQPPHRVGHRLQPSLFPHRATV